MIRKILCLLGNHKWVCDIEETMKLDRLYYITFLENKIVFVNIQEYCKYCGKTKGGTK